MFWFFLFEFLGAVELRARLFVTEYNCFNLLNDSSNSCLAVVSLVLIVLLNPCVDVTY